MASGKSSSPKPGPSRGRAVTPPPPRAQTVTVRQSDLPSWGLNNGDRINNRWIIGNPIGKGSFGVVYVCKCSETSDYFAIKVEEREKNEESNRTVRREREALKAMMAVEGFPTLRDHGRKVNYYWSVMTLLGSTLESMLKLCGGQFSLYTTVHIADQVLARIQSLHGEGFIHRDIKPDNFMLGLGTNKNIVYMCDFGLTKPYLDENGNHTPFKNQLPLIGTARFASTYNHKGLEQSRRDDLESWWFMIVYLLRGTLPWMIKPGRSKKEMRNSILTLKIELTEEFLKSLPPQFVTILIYIRQLNFEQPPDYAMIRSLLRQSIPYGFDENEIVLFDWQIRGHFSAKTTSIVFAKK